MYGLKTRFVKCCSWGDFIETHRSQQFIYRIRWYAASCNHEHINIARGCRGAHPSSVRWTVYQNHLIQRGYVMRFMDKNQCRGK